VAEIARRHCCQQAEQRAKRTKGVTIMMKSTAVAVAAMLLFSLALSAAVAADEAAGSEREMLVGRTQGPDVAPKPAIETLRGVVDSVDERNDTIKIRFSTETIELLRVQDGLLFNSVRYGDAVEITVQNIAGSKTIVGLRKE
jgi:hypothetical protein